MYPQQPNSLHSTAQHCTALHCTAQHRKCRRVDGVPREELLHDISVCADKRRYGRYSCDSSLCSFAQIRRRSLPLCKFINLNLTSNCSLRTNLWHCHDMQHYLSIDLSSVLLSQPRGYISTFQTSANDGKYFRYLTELRKDLEDLGYSRR